MFFIHTAGDTGKESVEKKKEPVQKVELKVERRRTVAETKHPPPEEDEGPNSGCPSSTAQAQQEASSLGLISPAAALNKAPSILERAAALSQTLEKPPVTPTSQKKSPSTAQVSPQTVEKLLVSPTAQEKIPSTIPDTLASPEIPQEEKDPGTAPATVDLRNSTQERGEAVSKQHTTKAEPADQRTEPPLSQ